MSILGIILTVLASCAVVNSCDADTARLTGYIGCHKRTFSARAVAGSAVFTVDGPADYIAITEVYPDTPEAVRYSYRIFAGTDCICRRTHTGIGFGPVTYFVRADRRRVGKVRIENDDGAAPAMISSVRAVRRAELDSLLAADSFRIVGLVPPGADAEAQNTLMGQLARNLPERRDYRIGKGFSYKVRYANRTPDQVRTHIDLCARWARQYKMPAMLGLVSWWSGTPLHEPDGLGRKFGDIKYQQVCYSPDFENPENEDLKQLLGDSYNRHYCLSVPNQWSSTPWLTMNSPRLNAYRSGRLREAVGMLKDTDQGSSWVGGIYLENEPRYWDTACEAGNPKAGRQGEVLWADFNPLVVRDAADDGVKLDPTDGLSNEELLWLHRNVGRYNQDTVDAARMALSEHDLEAEVPVYTHSLQHRDMFPGSAINHPASEWAYAEGARSGIEGLWSQPSDFYRVREWGQWANVNREENDGRHIDEHLWDLRVAYMMGADLYNSYNWHAIGPQRFFDYVKEFVAELPVVTLPAAEAKNVNSLLVEFKTPKKLQAFTKIELPVGCDGGLKGTACLTVSDQNDNSFTSAPARVDFPDGRSTNTVTFDFPTLAEVKSGTKALLRIRIRRSDGRQASPDEAFLTADSAAGIKLSLDLRTQRALSLWVIDRRQAPKVEKE